MANTIRLRRSSTAGAVPTTSQLSLGELAINTTDGKMYLKKDVSGTESIVQIGGSVTIASSPPSGASPGDIYWDDTDVQAFIYYDDGDTSQWVPLTPNASGQLGGTVTSIDVSGGTGLTSSGGPITTNGTITLNLDDTAVTAGSYTAADITIDAQGRITAAANGNTLTQGDSSIEVTDTGSDGTITLKTENTPRVTVDSSGNLLIGSTSAPTAIKLDIANDGNTGINLRNTNDSVNDIVKLAFSQGTGTLTSSNTVADIFSIVTATGTLTGNLAFRTNGGNSLNERMRIDSSGRLLVGTSSAPETFGGTLLQVVDAAGATAVLGRDDSTVSIDNPLGSIYFNTKAGGSWQESATIRCFADAAQGTGDVPSRLVFSTTADGASGPTEAWQIDNQGNLYKGNATSSVSVSNNVTTTILTVTSSSHTIVHFDVFFVDVAYKQGVWAGQYTLFASDAAGYPTASYYLKEHWQDVGSNASWGGVVVTVAVDGSGNVTLNADNNDDTMGGTAYVFITSITGSNPTITTY